MNNSTLLDLLGFLVFIVILVSFVLSNNLVFWESPAVDHPRGNQALTVFKGFNYE